MTVSRMAARSALRTSALCCAALAAAIVPALGAVTASPPPRVLADCNDVVDTTDSFSMNCVPTVIPDMSDQLTEAEVAMPGWNAAPGIAGAGARR